MRPNAPTMAAIRELRMDTSLQQVYYQSKLQEGEVMPYPLPPGTVSMHVRYKCDAQVQIWPLRCTRQHIGWAYVTQRKYHPVVPKESWGIPNLHAPRGSADMNPTPPHTCQVRTAWVAIEHDLYRRALEPPETFHVAACYVLFSDHMQPTTCKPCW